MLWFLIFILPETKDLVLTNIIPEESNECEIRGGAQLYIKKRSEIKTRRKSSYFNHALIECNENINNKNIDNYVATDNEDNDEDSLDYIKKFENGNPNEINSCKS